MKVSVNPALKHRIGIVLLWIVFCVIAGWIFYPRYNEPEPPPRLSTQLPAASSSDH
jgi:hypothetical protein